MRPESLDCTACEQRLLSAEDLDAAGEELAVSGHLAGCSGCREFFESLGAVKVPLDKYRVPDPSEELLESVIAGALNVRQGDGNEAADAALARANLIRIVMGGLVAFPLVLLINTLVGWALFEFTSLLFPRAIALYCISLFVLWASLGVSLSYASLPFLSLLAGKSSGRTYVSVV